MPLRELERLQAVNRFLKLEINRTDELDQIVKLAAQICQTPIALITLLDHQTQYIQAQVGFDAQQTDRKDAFCQYAIQAYEVMEVEDAEKDLRFAENPLVKGNPYIRFYAGSPLTTQDGHNLGSLCVIDQEPRQLDENQRLMLQVLSKQAIQILEFELSVNILKDQVIKAKQSEIKLRSFFESSVSCHLLLGKDSEILAFNKAVEIFIKDLFGVTIVEGMNVQDFVHKSYIATFVENYRAALSGDTVINERELSYPDGRTIYWYIIYEPAQTPEQEIIGVSFNATDVTDRVRQERLVYAQNESLRKIAFVQSHELRRPVSSILGLMNLIKDEEYFHHGHQELTMLDKAVNELDEKIKEIVSYTN